MEKRRLREAGVWWHHLAAGQGRAGRGDIVLPCNHRAHVDVGCKEEAAVAWS